MGEPDDSPASPPFHIDLIDIRVRYVICARDNVTFPGLPLMSLKFVAKYSQFSVAPFAVALELSHEANGIETIRAWGCDFSSLSSSPY